MLRFSLPKKKDRSSFLVTFNRMLVTPSSSAPNYRWCQAMPVPRSGRGGCPPQPGPSQAEPVPVAQHR